MLRLHVLILIQMRHVCVQDAYMRLCHHQCRVTVSPFTVKSLGCRVDPRPIYPCARYEPHPRI